ncbi:hypothetical protein CEXT_102341 [Caerostris extrusa]|uniref:Uncharacterized protein n=1 Tax=Caerostris extrusa TaxID=172846 RepID=A0AAV4N401_CAEEX|nr:hypothetical protein CEXT_102341 [Caerostris extrusa]
MSFTRNTRETCHSQTQCIFKNAIAAESRFGYHVSHSEREKEKKRERKEGEQNFTKLILFAQLKNLAVEFPRKVHAIRERFPSFQSGGIPQ